MNEGTFMSKIMKSIPLLLIVIMVIMLFPANVFATTAELFSLPTITSTVCSRCGNRMIFSYQEDEYTSETVEKCPNTHNDYGPHTHNWHHIYYVYECENCGTWGRKFIDSKMQCIIAGNSYSLK